ncbi:MAG: hypothetical protein M0006_03885 [Magnetospirillum sp.]|nr:hypothetical protein [Magnetospirillum sp.]
MMFTRNRFPAFAKGDRIAFTTLGRNPRALCGVVTDPDVRDRAGRHRVRVAVDGHEYLACRATIRRLR